jgi:DNA-binding beta-propeller fold protein YncE
MRRFVLLLPFALASAQSPFRLEKTIPLPGVEGRFDHLAIDVAHKHLFVSALGNNTLEVVDVGAGTRVTSLQGMHEPQGCGFAPDFHKLYVANGKDGKLRIFDSNTLKPAGEIDFGDDADNVRYDAPRKQIWVGYKDGVLGGIEAATNKRVGDIFIDAHPESFQMEKSGPRIFVNVPDAKEIEVVDRNKKVVVTKWPVTDPTANFPMALDEVNHRLFAGCRKPARVLVLDMDSGKRAALFPCPGDTDDLFYDGARKRLYVAGGEGFLEAFQQSSPDQYQSLGKIATASGARTGLYVPDLNRFYLAVPHRGNQGAEIRIYLVE